MEIIADAAKTGVAQEALQNATRRASKVMTEQEARQILGVSEETAWEEIVKVSSVCVSVLGSSLSLYQLNCVTFCFSLSRNTIIYLRGMRRLGAFTFSQRFKERRNVWKKSIEAKQRVVPLVEFPSSSLTLCANHPHLCMINDSVMADFVKKQYS